MRLHAKTPTTADSDPYFWAKFATLSAFVLFGSIAVAWVTANPRPVRDAQNLNDGFPK